MDNEAHIAKAAIFNTHSSNSPAGRSNTRRFLQARRLARHADTLITPIGQWRFQHVPLAGRVTQFDR